jgi:hypothetical protein
MRRQLGAMVVFAMCALLASPVPDPSSASPNTGWGVPVSIESDPGDGGGPRIAVDADGNAIAVWIQGWIWANRYVAGVGWGIAERISDGAGPWNYPSVGVDGEGNAIAVWWQGDGSRWSIYANRYVAGAGWDRPRPIEFDDEGDAYFPQLAVGLGGTAFVTWARQNATSVIGMWNRYVPEVGWGQAGVLNEDGGAAVAVDPQGNAMAIWSSGSILSRRYSGEAWGPPVVVDEDGGVRDIDMDGKGNAVAVWDDGLAIWSSRHVAGQGWAPREHIGAPGHEYPRVAMDAPGNAVVVWLGGSATGVTANRYVIGHGWGTGEEIGAPDTGNTWRLQLASNDAGHTFAVWQAGRLSADIYANRFVPGVGWDGAELVEFAPGWADGPDISVDAEGNAIAVWEVAIGDRANPPVRNMWANRYVAPDTTPPMLTLTSPADGLTTDHSTVVVSGTTEPGVQVAVKGVLASVGADGSFSLSIALREGTNLITVVATDSAGNRATASMTVTYENPVPGLERDLSVTRDALDALRRELAEARLATALALVGLAASIALAVWFRRQAGRGTTPGEEPRPEVDNR